MAAGAPAARMKALAGGLLLGLGAAWTSPNTLIGLLIGGVGVFGGARARWQRRERALVFRRMPGFGHGAVTLGNVILHGGEHLDVTCVTYAERAGRGREPAIRLGDHERAHVYQYMLLGPLFLPVYLACGGVSVRNPFERAADHYAVHGRGWWPLARF